MSKGRGSNLLGVGGQRRKVSKTAMRGAAHGRHGLGGGHDPLATKREILRKLRENAQRRNT